MTTYEKVISDINGPLDEESKKQSIAQALLWPEVTDEEITLMFTNIWVARFIDFELLKQCIEYYVKKQNIIHLFDPIGERAKSLHNDMPHELEEYAFELVISPNGYERFMGRHLWDEFEMDNSDIDILSMHEEFQMRFALSIVQDFMFPQKRLKKLLSLFNSQSENVRKVLLKVLPDYSLNYFGTVKNTFEQQSFVKSNELETFKNFLTAYDKRFELCRECKELYSEYLFPEEYDICRREITEHVREQQRIASKKNEPAFLKFIPTVELGRGGGWRDENGKIHPLGHFSLSQEMPMMIHSLTPLEEKEQTNYMFEDWTKLGEKDEA